MDHVASIPSTGRRAGWWSTSGAWAGEREAPRTHRLPGGLEERTREIGLLRAVGLVRLQLSSMITIEAVATAVFGAVLGTVLGLGLGVALQHGLRGEGLSTLGVPWGLILIMLVASVVVVGVVAAVAPSIRAARLDLLRAIAGG